MLTPPKTNLSDEVFRYLRSCEYLLAAANTTRSFTEEEVAIIKYYQAEIGKIPSVLRSM